MTSDPLEVTYKKINAANLGNTGRSSGRIVKTNLAERTQALEAMFYSAGYTLTQPHNVAAMQSRVERQISMNFIKFMNTMAISSPSEFWHLYEPNKIGISQARLFNFQASDQVYKSVMRMNLSFLPSKMLTPVPEQLKTPGPTGKFVKQRHRFMNKAIVFEYGQKITIRPVQAKKLAFLRNGKIVFSDGPINIDTARQPTFGQLTASTKLFMETVAPKIAKESYDEQTQKIKRGARAGLRRKPTNRKLSQASIKAMSKQIASSLR